jgi:DNA mismatch repair protein MutS2
MEKQAADLAAQFEQTAQSTIGELSQKARAKIARTRREYQESVEAVATPVNPAAPVPEKLKLVEGVRVRLKGVRQPATVRRLLSNGLIEVEAGFMKMQVSTADIEEVLAAGDAPKPKAFTFQQGPSFEQSYREINLIGQRAEEAMAQLEKFIDHAAMASVERVRIVHGHGMGILKRAVAELLKNNPHVATFSLAPPEQGGSGATVVELKV